MRLGRAVWLSLGLLAAIAAQVRQAPLDRAQAYERARALGDLGRKLFFDPALSASGKMSCATCHDPAFAYGPANALAVQRGGKNELQSGRRAVPSLKYLQVAPQFAEHYYDSENSGDDSVDGGPTGGLTWDGRVDRARDQARIPLLSPLEMANESSSQVVAAVRKSKYAGEIARLSRGTDESAIFETVLEALEAWQENDREFYPYNSKYDLWLAGKAELSDAEQRGLKLFTDPAKGDCARCHVATRGINNTPPQFTDYALVALGVPRNREIPANSDPKWFDLGLCGPERTDLTGQEGYCGRFRTPSLRNVATRKVFFHNGVFHSLKDAVLFYGTRDSNPEKWYPADGHGGVLKFDDLPVRYRGNVETDTPFGKTQGAKPSLNEQEVDDIVVFLETLTDGSR